MHIVMGKLHALVVLLLLTTMPMVRSISTKCETMYDPVAYTKCQQSPTHPLYGGGIIINPDFSDKNLTGWSPFGNCKLEVRTIAGNNFVAAIGRSSSFNGPSQILQYNLTSGMQYTLSAWLQINGTLDAIRSPVVIKSTIAVGGNKFICAGSVLAQAGCWTFLKGGFSLDFTPNSPSRLYFETTDTRIDIWLDSVSIQPFTDDEWASHQQIRINKLKRRKSNIYLTDGDNNPLCGAVVKLTQTRMGFPFGSAISSTILNNKPYQRWFLKRFNVAVFENELKWYSTETSRGHVNYNVSDQLLAFCKDNKIDVRGHNVFWDDPNFIQQWLKNLNKEDFFNASISRINSIMTKYRGQFIHWDVMNEMLHHSYFEDRIGPNASLMFYSLAQELDPTTPLFMNDYNTLETCGDTTSAPDVYAKKVEQLKEEFHIKKLGIGLEGHFSNSLPNLPYMRAILDKLATLGIPIWLTEVDINNNNNLTQASIYLEQVLREGFSHPAVGGIILWTALQRSGSCYRMCLTDPNMNNLPTGNAVDKLLDEWGGETTIHTTNHMGHIKLNKFVGTYLLTITYNHKSISQQIEITQGAGIQQLHIKISNEFWLRDQFI